MEFKTDFKVLKSYKYIIDTNTLLTFKQQKNQGRCYE